MERRALGSSLRISPLVLGGNVFGWTADNAVSFDILDRYADAGFQAIDTPMSTAAGCRRIREANRSASSAHG
jgi:aryl-alcohol dehydrogenase-like predicted oxidoreductase